MSGSMSDRSKNRGLAAVQFFPHRESAGRISAVKFQRSRAAGEFLSREAWRIANHLMFTAARGENPRACWTHLT